MDPSPPPLPDDVVASATTAENTLASAGPFWLHRSWLGINGLIISQAVLIACAVGTFIDYASIRHEIRPVGRLLNWIWHLHDVSYAIQWLSALYLLALAPFSGKLEDPFRTSRKALLYLGAAWVVVRFVPMMLLPAGVLRFVGGFAEIMQLAAIAALFLYLMKIAEQANDALLKLHLPLAMVLVCLTHAFDSIMRFRMSLFEAENLRLALMIAGAAYWIYLMLRMRLIVASLLPVDAIERSESQEATPPTA